MVLRFAADQGDTMNENEIVVSQVVYTFTSATMDKAFEACLNIGTLATCKESWRPTGVYPPAVLTDQLL